MLIFLKQLITKYKEQRYTMAQVNNQYLNQYNNPHAQVRQNLINDPPAQQEQIPVQQILAPPVVHPPVEYNIMLDIPLQQTIPLVPISRYKFPLEIWFFFGCLIQMMWFQYNRVHVIWLVWYMVIGFWRHGFIKRKVRFWGEFMNIMIWIMTNCYVFSGHKGAIFPFAIIMENLDYYYIGGHLSSIYLSYFSYVIGQIYADLKLYIIRKKLESRRKILIENELQRFIRNEINYSLQLKQIPIGTQQSVQQNMMREQPSNKQKQILKQKHCLFCLKELVQIRGISHAQIVRLQCHHRYHYSCLKKYVQHGNIFCPSCRKSFIESIIFF